MEEVLRKELMESDVPCQAGKVRRVRIGRETIDYTTEGRNILQDGPKTYFLYKTRDHSGYDTGRDGSPSVLLCIRNGHDLGRVHGEYQESRVDERP